MNWLEILKAADIEVEAEKANGLNDALSAALKSQVDDAVAGLKSKNSELLGKLTTQKQEIESIRQAAEDAARSKMTVEELNSSWQEKLTTEKAALQKIIDDMVSSSCNEKSEALALAIATEINPNYPKTVLPLIKNAIKTENVDGKFETFFLDEDGKRSAQTKDDFVKAFCENKDYAPVIAVKMGGADKVNTTQEQHGDKNLNILDKAAELMYGTQE